MKVLLVHNYYGTSAPSGEDIAVRNERRMLESRGIDVTAFEGFNDDIDNSGFLSRAGAAVNSIWSGRARLQLRERLKSVRPDLVHVHNTFAALSPSVYGVCKEEGVPVVQTLHNFRFFCPAGLFLRDARPCEECVERSLLQSIKHRCYRNSVAASATIAATLALHRAIGTYSNHIDRYITLTAFARDKVAQCGLPERKLFVKPNFVPDPPGPGTGDGGYVVYVGRILAGKGVTTLIDAWRRLPDIRLKIVGDGALRPELEAVAQREGLNIEFTGMQSRQFVLDAMSRAAFMVVPSEWYEGFPLVVAEAFACGTPLLASSIGSLEELVQEGVTGHKVPPGDAARLASVVRSMFEDKPKLAQMRRNARDYFDAHLTESQNFTQLMAIYSSLLASKN